MTPLVFLHGFAGTPNDFDVVEHQLASLLGRRPRVFAPYLTGHGRMQRGSGELPPTTSAWSAEPPLFGVPRRASFETEVHRLAAKIAAEVATPSHLVGYSLGGRLGLGLLLGHPELFSGATLISTHPGLERDEERRLREDSDAAWCALLLGAENASEPALQTFLEAWEAAPLFQSERKLAPEVLLARRARRLTHHPHGLAKALRQTGLAQMPAYQARLPSLAVPVTLLVGALDAKFVALAETMARRMRAARVVVLPQSGHNLILEKPHEVATVLGRQLLDPLGEEK